MKQLPNKQQGFTLLELLVVITLLAVLSVGALVAYEGVGDNAQATAAANNIVTADKMIRTYRQVEGAYPSQWDNLAGTSAQSLLAGETKKVFGQFTPVAGAEWNQIAEALGEAGIDELQTMTAVAPNVAPNMQHNEGYNTAGADESLIWDEDAETAGAPVALSIVPSSNGTDCKVGTVDLDAAFDTTVTISDSATLNKINDALESDGCHLVVALGFGHDVPGTTFGSSVAISTAPTFTSKDINPATNYARYIALFHVGSDAEDDGSATTTTDNDGIIQASEILSKARLLAVVDTEGNTADVQLAAANAAN